MATINREQVELLFSLSRQVYKQELEMKDALVLAAKENININSASDYIHNYRNLVNGIGYTRTMKAAGLEYYLESIYLLDGQEALSRALRALDLHIGYYQGISDSKVIKNQKILEYFCAKHNISVLDWEDELEDTKFNLYTEGHLKSIKVNVFERSRLARAKCIEFHGNSCSICGFNFSDIFGEIGDGFIHVHHLKELSELKKEYSVDPEKDLVPVCPNCHAMLHRKKPAYTLEELKMMIERVRLN